MTCRETAKLLQTLLLYHTLAQLGKLRWQQELLILLCKCGDMKYYCHYISYYNDD